MVYVQDKNGNPLMPTERHGKVKHLLRQGKAIVVTNKPFTIRLTYESTNYTQPVTLGIDSGYKIVGFSAVTETKELISGELELLEDMSKRIKEKARYRKIRRSRLRHRKPRFDNRSKEKGWLAPSIQHKLDSHMRLIEKLAKALPITDIVVEVAAFDIQRIENPDIQGVEYQQGEQLGSWNVREYVFHRDNHKCQNPDCKNKDPNPILSAHHLRYRSDGGTDRPEDQLTLCSICHAPENHKGFLKGWKPKTNGFKDATFMTTVRWKLVNILKELYESVEHSYGYITKTHRIELDIKKTHANDAFVIAGGKTQTRAKPISFKQTKRNNRCLEKWYDAKYVDIRTGEVVAANMLNCGRHTRNETKNGEDLRKYRGQKMSKGRRSIREQRYPYQINDLAIYDGKIHAVKGTQNKGAYVSLREIKKVPRADLLTPYKYCKGIA